MSEKCQLDFVILCVLFLTCVAWFSTEQLLHREAPEEWQLLQINSNEEKKIIYDQRLQNIRERCEKIKGQRPSLEQIWESGQEIEFPMIVDEGNKLMYCELPKVGSSNWKRVLIKLTDERFEDIRNVLAIRKPRKLDHYNLTYLTDYPVEKRLEMLKTYYTFTVVRDPIERVLSAYRDKAFDEFRGGIGRRTYSFLEKRNQADKFIDYDVESFHRFVAYLSARGPEVGAKGDFGIRVRHWTRFFDICRVCDVDWNFLGKVESIVEDAAYMLADVNLSSVVEYPYYRKATDTDQIKRYFSGLTKEGLERLYYTYQLDFELFQYSIPQYVLDVV
jgi:chondroitin 4-sulfotransferase 11